MPGSEEIGTTGNITVSATAQWLGQSGAVAIKQNRDFNFSVEVISATTGIQEKILEKPTPEPGEQQLNDEIASLQSKIAELEAKTGESATDTAIKNEVASLKAKIAELEAQTGESVPASSIGKWLSWIVVAAVVVLGAILTLLYIRRRRD